MRLTKEFLYLILFSLMFLTKIKICACEQNKPSYAGDDSVDDISMADIYNIDFIPVKLLTDQLDKEQISKYSTHWNYFNGTDLRSAVKAMRYHRHMMNEYLLSDYLSAKLMGTASGTQHAFNELEKRLGKAKNISSTNNLKANNNSKSFPSNHKLIDDVGSSQYSSWLKRMNTYEDIRRQMLNKSQQSSAHKKKFANLRRSLGITLDPNYVDDESDYLDDGDITGYAFTSNPTDPPSLPIGWRKPQKKSRMEGKDNSLHKQAVNKVGYDNGYNDYTAAPHSLHKHSSDATSKPTNEIGLKDITDIALTTLAFLSFGMFILQVLICITMNKEDTSSVVMLPMEGTDNADIAADGNTEEIRRKRRSISSMQMPNIEMMDLVAKRALFSLNAVTSISKDGEGCHHFSLCENNRFARRLGTFKKLWIPVWSLGISWLSVKFNNSNKMGSITKNPNPVLNSLRAIIVGLNNGDCSANYICL